MRVGDGGFIAESIASRTGIGTCAFRADAQQTAFIDAGDRASAGAYGVNIEQSHRLTSVDVPPISKPRILRNPDARAVSSAPTTPPAGPESTVRIACRRASLVVMNPPFDCMMEIDCREARSSSPR